MQSVMMVALLGHFALVVLLYVWLTVERLRAVRAGDARIEDFAHANRDPARARRIQRNLANQFEAPMFAYFAALYLIGAGAVGWFDALAAWLFLAGRVVHTLVQTLGDDVALRGKVYMISFVGILLLMAHVGWLVAQRILA